MKKALYILGTGFDLAHEIHSSYAHFKEWLIKEGYNEHVQTLERHFCFECVNWSDYETALGSYDLDDIYEQIAGDLSIDLDHLMRSQAIFEDAPDLILGTFWRDITGLIQSTFYLQNVDSVFRQMPNISHLITPSLLKKCITSLQTTYSIYTAL